MAGTRNPIKFDPALTKRFFEHTDEYNDTPSTSFILPATPSELPQFLDNQDQRIEYRQNFSRIVDQLADWAAQHGIDNTACRHFKEEHLGYSGSDSEHNRTNFHLYREGIATLSEINQLIQDDNIPLNFRINTIKNLLGGLLECGPGTCTNIIKSHLELQSCKNASAYWMKLREDIVKDAIVNLLNSLELTPEQDKELNLETMEIHYVTAVLNHFSDTIGIKAIKDPNIQYCQEDLLAFLIETIQEKIPDLLSLIFVASTAYQDLNCDEIRTDTYLNLTTDIERIEDALLRLGVESEHHHYYHRNSIIAYSESSGEVELTWHFPYSIEFSIYSRMIQQGFIDLTIESIHKINDETKIHYLPQRPLSSAYIKIKNNTFPLLVYGIEHIETTDISDFILSSQTTKNNQLDVLFAITKYLKFCKSEPEQKLTSLVSQLIGKLTPSDLTLFTKLLSDLPHKFRQIYLQAMPKDMTEQIANNLNVLHTFLSRLTSEEASRFMLHQLPIKQTKLLMSFEDMQIILRKLSTPYRYPFLKLIDEYAVKLICHHKKFMVIMQYLDIDDKIKLIELFMSYKVPEKMISNFNQLAAICLALPEDKWPQLLSVYKIEWLITPANAHGLSQLKEKLGKEKWRFFTGLLNINELIPLSKNFECLTTLLTLAPAAKWKDYLCDVKKNSRGILFAKIHELPRTLKIFTDNEKSHFIELFVNLLLPDIIQDVVSCLSNKSIHTSPSNPKVSIFEALFNKLRGEEVHEKYTIISAWVREHQDTLNHKQEGLLLFSPHHIGHDLLMTLQSIFSTKPAHQNHADLGVQTEQQTSKLLA